MAATGGRRGVEHVTQRWQCLGRRGYSRRGVQQGQVQAHLTIVLIPFQLGESPVSRLSMDLAILAGEVAGSLSHCSSRNGTGLSSSPLHAGLAAKCTQTTPLTVQREQEVGIGWWLQVGAVHSVTCTLCAHAVSLLGCPPRGVIRSVSGCFRGWFCLSRLTAACRVVMGAFNGVSRARC